MEVLNHHIYEYKKGLRNLVLHTICSDKIESAKQKLARQHINFCVQKVSERKFNIFFGKRECVNIANEFTHKSLSDLTAEEDFMLGIMLGYDCMQQCQRYITKKGQFIDNMKLIRV
ncbi:MAG: DUF2023 family protein [Mangrovibacterium sp.]